MNPDRLIAQIIRAENALWLENDELIKLPEDPQARLILLREIVGGNIEAVPLSSERHLVMNADGKLQDHKVNITATMMASINESIMPDDYIAGPAVLVYTEILC